MGSQSRDRRPWDPRVGKMQSETGGMGPKSRGSIFTHTSNSEISAELLLSLDIGRTWTQTSWRQLRKGQIPTGKWEGKSVLTRKPSSQRPEWNAKFTYFNFLLVLAKICETCCQSIPSPIPKYPICWQSIPSPQYSDLHRGLNINSCYSLVKLAIL